MRSNMSKFTIFLSNPYLILLVLVICLYYIWNNFTYVDEQKKNINVSIIQNASTNEIGRIPHLEKYPGKIDINTKKLSNPFVSSWLHLQSIEEKKRKQAAAEAQHLAEKQRLREEKRKEEERKRKEKARLQAQQNSKTSTKNKHVKKQRPKQKQKKHFRYVGHTLINGKQLILIEVLENRRIHYITENELIETYKIHSFDNNKLELEKDEKIYSIKRGNIVVLEI